MKGFHTQSIQFRKQICVFYIRVLYLTNLVGQKKIENVEDKCKYYPPWHKVYAGPFHKTSHPQQTSFSYIFNLILFHKVHAI